MGRSTQILPATAPPQAQGTAAPETEGLFDGWMGGLGNSGLLEMLGSGGLDGGTLNAMTGGVCLPSNGDPVQDIVNKKVESNANYDNTWEMAWGEAYQERGKTDPDNKNEDLAAAEHYLWARHSADKTARDHGNGTVGHLLGMGDALLTGGLALGYEGYKTGAYALKDHNMGIGAAMAMTGVGLIPGLAMMAFGDDIGEGALKAVSSTDKLPSRPSLKGLGWGLKGSWDAFADQAGQLVD